MPLPKLQLDVPQEGFSFADGQAVLRAKPSTGPSAMRLDMLDAPLDGQCSMVLEAEEYQYWRAFYKTTIMLGSLPFLMDLVIESAEIEEREVKIIPGSLRTTIQGTAHIVQFSMEVRVYPESSIDDAALVMLFNNYGSNATLILNRLARLVNLELPSDLY